MSEALYCEHEWPVGSEAMGPCQACAAELEADELWAERMRNADNDERLALWAAEAARVTGTSVAQIMRENGIPESPGIRAHLRSRRASRALPWVAGGVAGAALALALLWWNRRRKPASPA